jgi:hypothetical protein
MKVIGEDQKQGRLLVDVSDLHRLEVAINEIRKEWLSTINTVAWHIHNNQLQGKSVEEALPEQKEVAKIRKLRLLYTEMISGLEAMKTDYELRPF